MRTPLPVRVPFAGGIKLDERQHADIAKALDKIVTALRAILIFLSAILGTLWFHWR